MIDNEYEFRRGYKYGFYDGNAEGKAWEQRRIIKLIESQITPCLCEAGCMGSNEVMPEDVIELIKGETNGN